MNTDVRVKLNVLGVNLDENQINAVLNCTDNSTNFQRKWLANFFQLDPSKLTTELLSRYAQADAKMTRISAGTHENDIHARLINTLASAKRCYSYSEFFACIELCALHGEMLANYLCITSKDFLLSASIIEKLLPDDQKIIRKHQKAIFFSDLLGQKLRLRWLQCAQIISLADEEYLKTVHNLRISYFHRWSPKENEPNEDALICLEKISRVSANHLELLGQNPREFNQENLSRVVRYMDIIS